MKGIVRHDGRHIPLPVEGWQEQTRWQAARCGYQERCHRCSEGRDSTEQLGRSHYQNCMSLTLTQTMQDQDGLVHFTWTVREAAPDSTTAGVPELDLVLFPGQSTFSRLHGRRMFLLKYEGQEHFFWYNLQCGQFLRTSRLCSATCEVLQPWPEGGYMLKSCHVGPRNQTMDRMNR